MCGICGIVDLREPGVSVNKLQAMNDLVIHRGPDDEGVALFTETGDVDISYSTAQLKNGKKYSIGLAHRRLSILDLSQKAHQARLGPLHSAGSSPMSPMLMSILPPTGSDCESDSCSRRHALLIILLAATDHPTVGKN